MFGSIIVMFFLPWLDRSPVKSIRYKGILSKLAIFIFAATFIILGWLGVKAPSDTLTLLAQFLTVVYFAFFFLMPAYSRGEGDRSMTITIMFLVTALMVVGTIFYWWTNTIATATHPDVPMLVTMYTGLLLLLLFLLGIKPLFISADKTKPVPERVTS
jgi:ubiquinol-cytochrome c reductase cytochrome b subunit